MGKTINDEDKLNRIFHRIKKTIGFDFTSEKKSYKEIRTKSPNSRNWKTEYVKASEQEKYIKDHFRGKKDLSLPIFRHTKYVMIDVDGASRLMLERIHQHLGGNSVFIEANSKTNHYHIYFLFDEYLNTNKRKAIEKFFMEEYFFKIEVIDHNHFLRLPGSKEYDLRGLYDPSQKYSIKHIPDFEKCLDLFDNATVTPVDNIINLKNITDNGTSLSFQRYFFDYDSVQYSSKSEEEYSYGKGTRFFQQRNFAFYCVHRKYTFEQYKEKCIRLNDGTSRDMKFWSKVAIDKELKNYYNLAQKVAKKYYKTQISEFKEIFVDKNVSILEYYTDLYYYLRDVYRTFEMGKVGSKVEREKIEEAIRLYWFIFQKQKHELETQKEYSNKKYSEFSKAASLSRKFLIEQYKQHYNIKRDIVSILRLLEYSHLIHRVRTKEGYTKSYKRELVPSHFVCPAIFMDTIAAQQRLSKLSITLKVFSKNIQDLPLSFKETILNTIHRKVIQGINKNHWGEWSREFSKLFKVLDEEYSELLKHFSSYKNCKSITNLSHPYSTGRTKHLKFYRFNRYESNTQSGDKITIPQGYENTEIFKVLDTTLHKKNKNNQFYSVKEYSPHVIEYLLSKKHDPIFDGLHLFNNKSFYSYTNIDKYINLTDTSITIENSNKDTNGSHDKDSSPEDYINYTVEKIDTYCISKYSDVVKVKKEELKIPILWKEYPQFSSVNIQNKSKKNHTKQLLLKV